MNKIINWVGGSFFRTLGRILVYILLGFLLALLLSEKNIKLPIFQVLNVDASTFIYGNQDANEYRNMINSLGFEIATRSESRNCSGSTTCNSVISSEIEDEYNYLHLGNLNLTNNGFAVQVLTNQGVNRGFLYSYTGLYCFNNSISANGYNMYLYGSPEIQNTYNGTGIVRLSEYSFDDGNDVFPYCYEIQNFFESTGLSAWVMQQIKSSSGTRQGVFLGYRLVNIGSLNNLSSSDIQNIINNANSNQTNSINNNITSSTNSVNNRITAMEEEVSSSIDSQTQADKQNTEDIINNQNQNTQDSINSQKVCSYIDKSNVSIQDKYLNANGIETSASSWGITSYIAINNSAELKILSTRRGTASFCFYNTNKTKLSCVYQGNYEDNDIIDIPEGTSYMRFNIYVPDNMPSYSLCKNGNQSMSDTLTDDSINESGISDFTNGLNKDYSSLTPFSDFLNLPLTWIQSLFASGQNCTAIHLPLPYLNNKYLDLPCMTEFWQQMGAIGTLIQVVWIAIVGVRIFNGLFLLTCETIDPNPDRDMTKLRTWEL